MYDINTPEYIKNIKISTHSRSHLVGKIREYFTRDLGNSRWKPEKGINCRLRKVQARGLGGGHVQGEGGVCW